MNNKLKARKTNIADALAEYVGKDVAELVNELSRKKDYSEFKLAEALNKEVNATRNLLYKLHNLNLASFIKKKDHKIGWYIYYWTFHKEKVGSFVLNEKLNKLALLREKILNEAGGEFFSCPNKCARLDFDESVDLSFRCPECGELLTQDKNTDSAALRSEMAELESDIRDLGLQEEKKKQTGIEERERDEKDSKA